MYERCPFLDLRNGQHGDRRDLSSALFAVFIFDNIQKSPVQTVEFPELLTTATDKATGTKMVGAFDGQTVIDKVDYRLMGEGTEIITVTELVKKGESAEEDEDEVVKTIRSKQTVSGDGSYEVEIPFDAAGFGPVHQSDDRKVPSSVRRVYRGGHGSSEECIVLRCERKRLVSRCSYLGGAKGYHVRVRRRNIPAERIMHPRDDGHIFTARCMGGVTAHKK